MIIAAAMHAYAISRYLPAVATPLRHELRCWRVADMIRRAMPAQHAVMSLAPAVTP